ncbi:MAG: endonuclease/exonuclease/phosphatase family protein, partial [Bacteroidales bacterium]
YHNPNHWEGRKALLLSVIQKNNPDIIGFQEMIPSQLKYLMENLPGYFCYGTGREADGSGEGCYIFYRKNLFTIDSLHSGTRWYSSTPNIPGTNDMGDLFKRIITFARFKINTTNQYFYMFNTHLTYIDSLQVKYVDFLTSTIKSRANADPFILTGDFNADEKSVAIHQLKTNFAAEKIVDTYREIFPNEVLSTFNNFSQIRDGRKIDYIFIVDKQMKTINAFCDTITFNGRYPSDHFPLMALVQIKN